MDILVRRHLLRRRGTHLLVHVARDHRNRGAGHVAAAVHDGGGVPVRARPQDGRAARRP